MAGDRGLELLGSAELADRLWCPPCFWRRAAPSASGTGWAAVCATGEYDREQCGSVAALAVLDQTGSRLECPRPKGLSLAVGYQMNAGDLDGDGRDELFAVDCEGRVLALDTECGPLAGFPSAPSGLIRLARAPLTMDVDDDGASELVLVSVEAEICGSESMLSVLRASGTPLPGFPLPLDPPAVAVPALVRQGSQQSWHAVVCHGDGSIGALGLSSPTETQVAGPGTVQAGRTALVALDLEGDGRDEIVFASGGSEISSARVGGGTAPDGWPFVCPEAAFTGLAKGVGPEGEPLLYAYDAAHGQLVSLGPRGDQRAATPLGSAGSGATLAHLSTAGESGPDGPPIVAVIAYPDTGTEAGVDPGAHAAASPASEYAGQPGAAGQQGAPLPLSASLPDSSPARDNETLLTTGGGEEASVYGAASTEMWLLGGAAGRPRSAPLRFPGQHPFLDAQGKWAMGVAALRDHAGDGAWLLLGLNRDGPTGGFVHLCRVT